MTQMSPTLRRKNVLIVRRVRRVITDHLAEIQKKLSKEKRQTSLEPRREGGNLRSNIENGSGKPKKMQKVLELYEIYGQNWTLIASYLGGRTGKQVRDRYLNNLRPGLKMGEWTEEEEPVSSQITDEDSEV